MFKKASFSPAQPRRAKTRLFPGKAGASEVLFPYGEPLSEARTKLGDFFNILLGWRP
jgi:hypothetical protein